MNQWIYENFILPHCRYYTVPNTILYSIIFIIAIIGVYKLLQKLSIKIDSKMFFAVIPFIIYGGWTRALNDHAVYQGWWWCTPFLYFIVFGVTIAALLAGVALRKKVPYHKTMFALGLIPLAYNASLTHFGDTNPATIAIPIAIGWAILFFAISKYKPKIMSRLNAAIMSVHLFDASATFTALTFVAGMQEEHVLPTFLINNFGPWIMFPLKLVVIYTVLYVIDKYGEDDDFSKFLKLSIFILGMAQGTRDTLTMIL